MKQSVQSVCRIPTHMIACYLGASALPLSDFYLVRTYSLYHAAHGHLLRSSKRHLPSAASLPRRMQCRATCRARQIPGRPLNHCRAAGRSATQPTGGASMSIITDALPRGSIRETGALSLEFQKSASAGFSAKIPFVVARTRLALFR